MALEARAAVSGLLSLATVAGIGYTLFSTAQLRKFKRKLRTPHPAFTPPVTVLKPLHGAEPRLYENLRSFCTQEYPEFQIVFGAADADDPALEVARRLQHEFPSAGIEVVSGAPGTARNPKIANLLGMIGKAKHEILVIADSDIHAGAGYLRAVASCFADTGVGAATCLFSGLPNETAASRAGAMAVNDHFIPSVLVAAELEPLSWCLGATVAVRAGVLKQIGGLQAVGEHLADDYEIGRRVFCAGYRIALVPAVVTTDVHERDFGSLWHHEVRWARTVFAARPAGYTGSVIANPLALGFLAAVTAGFRPANLALLGAAAGVRLWSHFTARDVLAPYLPPAPGLIPVRDGLSLGVWCSAFVGRRVGWRGASYAVSADGRMLGHSDAV
jgi:ceramide glucosyltransferase